MSKKEYLKNCQFCLNGIITNSNIDTPRTCYPCLKKIKQENSKRYSRGMKFLTNKQKIKLLRVNQRYTKSRVSI